MAELPPVIEPPPFRDRSSGLKWFGILLIVLGLFCALLVPLALLGTLMMPQTGPNAVPAPSMLMPCAIYGGLAVSLIWLGIGSIQAQRWARTLIMIFSWSGLYFGILMTGFFLYFVLYLLPMPDNQIGVSAMRTVMAAFMTVFFGIFFIALPGWMAWFYTKKDVKATCEVHHAQPSWAESRPPTVLLLTLWLGFSVMTMLVLPFAYHGTVPQFGMVISGTSGIAFCLIQAALLLVGTVLYYRLAPSGWWLLLGLQVIMMASGILNALYLDYNAFYTAIGYTSEQLDNIQKYNFMKGGFGVGFMILCMIPALGLLAWTHRYFASLRPTQSGEVAERL